MMDFIIIRMALTTGGSLPALLGWSVAARFPMPKADENDPR
jgi:hypothetical protein